MAEQVVWYLAQALEVLKIYWYYIVGLIVLGFVLGRYGKRQVSLWWVFVGIAMTTVSGYIIEFVSKFFFPFTFTTIVTTTAIVLLITYGATRLYRRVKWQPKHEKVLAYKQTKRNGEQTLDNDGRDNDQYELFP